jgi:flavin-binding protein dodecin
MPVKHRIAEVSSLDMKLDDGKVTRYRAKVKVPFKYLENL